MNLILTVMSHLFVIPLLSLTPVYLTVTCPPWTLPLLTLFWFLDMQREVLLISVTAGVKVFASPGWEVLGRTLALSCGQVSPGVLGVYFGDVFDREVLVMAIHPLVILSLPSSLHSYLFDCYLSPLVPSLLTPLWFLGVYSAVSTGTFVAFG